MLRQAIMLEGICIFLAWQRRGQMVGLISLKLVISQVVCHIHKERGFLGINLILKQHFTKTSLSLLRSRRRAYLYVYNNLRAAYIESKTVDKN